MKRVMSKKGLSAVVVTLLLVMLSIVLVGVVFVVVNNVVTKGTGQASSNFDCTLSSVSVTAASCTQAGTCNVTVKRDAGSDTIGGVTLVFTGVGGGTNSTTQNASIITPASHLFPSLTTGVTNVSQIQASVYYLQKSGQIYPCPGQTTFTDVQVK